MRYLIKYETLNETTDFINRWTTVLDFDGDIDDRDKLHLHIKCKCKHEWPEGDQFLMIMWTKEI